GAPAAAAELAELAVRLTPATARDRLRERRVEAAGYHLPAGDLAKSAAILEHLAEEVPAGGARADALLLLASSQQSFERSLDLAERALVEARGDDARGSTKRGPGCGCRSTGRCRSETKAPWRPPYSTWLSSSTAPATGRSRRATQKTDTSAPSSSAASRT